MNETIAQWIAQDEAEEWEDAKAFIVESYDLKTGTHKSFGPFWSVTEALAHAEKHEAGMAEVTDEGEAGWKCVVRPLWEPDPA